MERLATIVQADWWWWLTLLMLGPTCLSLNLFLITRAGRPLELRLNALGVKLDLKVDRSDRKEG